MSDASNLISKLLMQCSPNAIVPAQVPSKPFSGLAFIGIAPGDVEVMGGMPFIGPSGQVLNRCLDAVGIDRDTCWLGNVCPVRLAADRGLGRGEVEILREPLIESLTRLDPKVIVTLGAEPTRSMFIDKDVEIMLTRSHVLQPPDFPGAKVIPTIHPAFALRQSLALTALLMNDLLIAKRVLNGEDRYRPWTYTVIKDINHLQSVLYQNNGQLMALDSEATDKNPFRAIPFMLSFAFENNPDHGYVIYCPPRNYNPDMGYAELIDGRDSKTPLEDVLAVFAKFDPRCIIFNLLYDYVLLGRFGWRPRVFVDPMYAYTLLDENSPKDLKTLGSFFSGIGPYEMDFNCRIIEEWLPYAACDAVNTIRVWQAIEKRFVDNDMKWLLWEYQTPLLLELAETSMRGLQIDLGKLSSVDTKMQDEINGKVATMHAVAGYKFNHRSTDQLAPVFEKLGIPILGRTKKTKKPSFRKELLDRLADRYPFVGLLKEVKSLEKLYSSYIKNVYKFLDAENRVHTNFDIKKTGRLSASEPALQTLPRDSVILEMFCARPGNVLIKCDFSAAEFRWLGFLAGDERWLNPVLDVHISNASFFYGTPIDQVTKAQRQAVKFIGFGKVYGSGINTLARQLNCSESEAQKMEDKFFDTFPKVKKYMDDCKDVALNRGFVKNYFGLERHFFYDLRFGVEEDRARVIREAYNFGPQSTVAIWTNLSLVKVQQWYRQFLPDANVVLQIHDAVVVEVPVEHLYQAAYAMWKILRRPVDNKSGFFVPVDLSIGQDLLNQVKIIPFAARDFDEAFERSCNNMIKGAA